MYRKAIYIYLTAENGKMSDWPNLIERSQRRDVPMWLRERTREK